jgi:carboxypeptidase PM20D1
MIFRRKIYVKCRLDDVQVQGTNGAANIARVLEERGIEFEFILDEGTVILEGSIVGAPKPLAL